MNQNEFFNILMDGLKDFSEIKLQDIISYYEHNFTLGLVSGKTEEEIIHELGNPNLIVTKYRNEDFKTPINSEPLPTDTNAIFTKDPNIVIDNNSNDTFSDFKTNPNYFEANNKLNSFKASDSYECINSIDAFHDLDTSNLCTYSNENDYKSSIPNYNFNGESDFDSNNNTNANYSNFNNEQNSNSNSNNSNNQNSKNIISQFNVNAIIKICIAGLAIIIFFPVITAIIGCILGLLGVAISILVASIGLLVGGTFTSFIGLPNVPMFISNFPYPVIVFFSLGSISLSIFLTLVFYYLCKFFIKISIKSYKSLKSKGGDY